MPLAVLLYQGAETTVVSHLLDSGAAALLSEVCIEWHANVHPAERSRLVAQLEQLNVTIRHKEGALIETARRIQRGSVSTSRRRPGCASRPRRPLEFAVDSI